VTRSSTSPKLPAFSFALMLVLLLVGCSNPAAPESPATPTSTANPTASAASSSSPTSSDPAASSIEDAVTDATQLLSDLDQDFAAD